MVMQEQIDGGPTLKELAKIVVTARKNEVNPTLAILSAGVPKTARGLEALNDVVTNHTRALTDFDSKSGN